MNFVSKKDVYSKSRNLRPNTFIGGIAKLGGTGVNAPIRTVNELAQKLSINSNRITGFRIVNNDVECRIQGTYSLPDFGATLQISANQNITYYHDSENLAISQANLFGFRNCLALKSLRLNGMTQATSIFRQCSDPDLTVEMTALKTVTSAFFSQLPITFNQSKLVGFPSLENLRGLSFHQVSGFTEIDLSAKIIQGQTFYEVANCQKYFLNNLERINNNDNIVVWTHGGRACRLIEMKKCKIIESPFFSYTANTIVHATEFKMKLNAAVISNPFVTAVKTNFPYAVLEFYDDNNNLVSTL